MGIKYAVVDDHGDNWEHGDIAHMAPTLDRAMEWAEDENYHSASIVIIDELTGKRERVEVQ